MKNTSFKVRIKKVHYKYSEVFSVGDVVEFSKNEKTGNYVLKSNVDGELYSAEDYGKCFKMHAIYDELFEKIDE